MDDSTDVNVPTPWITFLCQYPFQGRYIPPTGGGGAYPGIIDSPITAQCRSVSLTGCVRASVLPISGSHLTSQIRFSDGYAATHYRLTKTWQAPVIFRLFSA